MNCFFVVVFFLSRLPPRPPPRCSGFVIWFCRFVYFCPWVESWKKMSSRVVWFILKRAVKPSPSPSPWTCAFWLRVRPSVLCRGWRVVLSVTLLWFLFPLWSSEPCPPPPPHPIRHTPLHHQIAELRHEKKNHTKCITESVNNQRKHKG